MAGVGVASALPCDGEGLAGVAADQNVDRGDVGVEAADVGINRDTREPVLEDSLAVRVVLAHPHGVASDCEVEAADAGEEAADIHPSSGVRPLGTRRP
jgi:hypothetical protein